MQSRSRLRGDNRPREKVIGPVVVCKDIPGRASFLHFLQLRSCATFAVDFVTTNV